jgi:metal-responsive CopG/Arc/MetJ family transcriptional regulator
MKTAISLPDHLFNRAEKLARDLKMSRSQLYASALLRFLDDKSQENITGRLNSVYPRLPSRVDARLRKAQARSIREPW